MIPHVYSHIIIIMNEASDPYNTAYLIDAVIKREYTTLAATRTNDAAKAPGRRCVFFVSLGADMIYTPKIIPNSIRNRITNLIHVQIAKTLPTSILGSRTCISHSPDKITRPDTYIAARNAIEKIKLNSPLRIPENRILP
jgi:hypothetical protein